MNTVCPNCEESREVPPEHLVGIDRLTIITDLDESQVCMALRMGTLPMPRAVGVHGERLWAAGDIDSFMARTSK